MNCRNAAEWTDTALRVLFCTPSPLSWAIAEKMKYEKVAWFHCDQMTNLNLMATFG